MSYERIVQTEDSYIAPTAYVCGDVRIGQQSSIWYGTVVRGDEAEIVIGNETNIQDNCVLHTGVEQPVLVGSRVTIGHGCIIHGCTIKDESLIGMGTIIMDGAVIGSHCLVAAGSLVTEGTHIPDGSMVMGRPARIRRALTEEETARLGLYADHYVKNAAEHFG